MGREKLLCSLEELIKGSGSSQIGIAYIIGNTKSYFAFRYQTFFFLKDDCIKSCQKQRIKKLLCFYLSPATQKLLNGCGFMLSGTSPDS